MPISKEKMRQRKRRDRERKKIQGFLKVKAIMTSADIRAMKVAGLTPEDIENETGKVSSYLYYALLRDRDAIKAHLSWLQASGGYNARKAATLKRIETMREALVK